MTSLESVQRELFRTLSDEAPRPILMTNADANIVYVNAAWQRQFGYTIDEVLGKNPRMLKSGLTPPEEHTRMWQLLRAGKTFRSDKIIDRRKDGRFFNLFTTTFPINADGQTYYVQVLDDISAQKKQEKHRETFVSAAAHDIRSPVANLRLLTDMLIMRKTFDAATTEELISLQEEVARLSRLVHILLDPALMRDGDLVLHKTRFDVMALLRSAVKSARLKTNQTIVLASRAHTYVIADRDRLQQVVMNLLENAIKYAPDSQISVRVATEKRRLIVTVSDTGPGIPRSQRRRIFDAFFQNGTADTHKTGVGLGLYIAKRIAQAHHGSISVRSSIGAGTTFSLSIPQAPVRASRASNRSWVDPMPR